jgi:hypothetical protein
MMTLVVDWGTYSPRPEQLLARGHPHCGSRTGCLTQHRDGERRRAVNLTIPRWSVEGLRHVGIARKTACAAGAE